MRNTDGRAIGTALTLANYHCGGEKKKNNRQTSSRLGEPRISQPWASHALPTRCPVVDARKSGIRQVLSSGKYLCCMHLRLDPLKIPLQSHFFIEFSPPVVSFLPRLLYSGTPACTSPTTPSTRGATPTFPLAQQHRISRPLNSPRLTNALPEARAPGTRPTVSLPILRRGAMSPATKAPRPRPAGSTTACKHGVKTMREVLEGIAEEQHRRRR